jgi:hypothetical protein
MAEMDEPISEQEMAGHVRVIVNQVLRGISEAVRGNSFELTSPATGQRFRVTVTEVSAEAAVDAAIAAIAGPGDA